MITMNLNSKKRLLYNKKNPHEDNLKCFLYHHCSLQGIKIVTEYRIYNPKTLKTSVVDAVIIHNNEVVALIEVKGVYKKDIPRKFNKNNRQFRKYNDLDMPFFLIYRKRQISELIQYLKSNILK